MKGSRVELLLRVLSDRLPDEQLDFAYLVAQTPDNQASVLDRGAELLAAGRVIALSTCGAGRVPGYAGCERWTDALKERGVSHESIVPLPFPERCSLNTRTEAEALLGGAEAHELEDLVIVASPHHQLRAFMTVATVFLLERSPVRLWSVPGVPLRWDEAAAHSQGKERHPRLELVRRELERIERYQKKGDLAPDEDVLDWLARRDRASRRTAARA